MRASASEERSIRADDVQRAYQYARIVRVAADHHVVSARCLHQALVVHQWLLAEALPSELRIGVRRLDGQFGAHAWVELGSHVIDEQAAEVAKFTPLSRPWGRTEARQQGAAVASPAAQEVR
jgi:hypothetical protein